MKNITIKTIESLKPNKELLTNLKKKHPKFKGTLEDFLILENVPGVDKAWVASELLEYYILEAWALMCVDYAALDLSQAYGKFTITRNCLEAARKVMEGDLCESKLPPMITLAREEARGFTTTTPSAILNMAEAISRRSKVQNKDFLLKIIRETDLAVWPAQYKLSDKLLKKIAIEQSEREDINISFLISLL